MIDVSIITPAFNAERYLGEVIESVQMQTGILYEHLVVNDGSIDKTAEILNQFAKNDPRIIAFHRSNSGEASAVNHAFSMCKGEFVVVVNSDDPLLRGHLVSCVRMLRANPEVVAVYTDWKMIDENSNPIRTNETLDFSYRALLADFVCIPGPGAMFRRHLVDREYLRDEQLRYISDYEQWIHLCKSGPFLRIPSATATWRMHENGLTAKIDAIRYQQEVVVVEEIAANAIKTISTNRQQETRWLRQLHAHALYYVGLKSIIDARINGRKLMLRSIAAKPLPSINYETHHRQPFAILAVMALPVSAWFVRIRNIVKYRSKEVYR